jgi:hypothetical protein
VSFTKNILNDLNIKLLEDRSSIPNVMKHKVLIIGDSHLRGYCINKKTCINDRFQVSGFIKPGTKIILEQTTNEIENLLPSDFIILSCGSNDIVKVKLSEIFSDILDFIKRVAHTKVILLTIPVRHIHIHIHLFHFNRSNKDKPGI